MWAIPLTTANTIIIAALYQLWESLENLTMACLCLQPNTVVC